MGIFRYALKDDIFALSGATLSVAVGNTATGYSVNNIADYDDPQLRWQSQDTTQQILKANLGSEISIAAIVVNGINIPNFYFQANSTATGDAWGTPDAQSAGLSSVLDERTGRYKYIYIPDHSADPDWGTVQWLRMVMAASQTPYSGSTYRVESVLVLTNLRTFGRNPKPTYEYKRRAHMRRVDYANGGATVARANNWRKWMGMFTFGYMGGDINACDDYWAFVNGMEERGVFFENQGDLGKVYLCRGSEEFGAEWNGVGAELGGAVMLEEII